MNRAASRADEILQSFGLGSLAGVVAVSLEAFVAARSLSAQAAAVYAVLGGLLAVGGSLPLALFRRGGSLQGGLLAVSAFVAFEALHYLHSRPMLFEHPLSARRLLADVGILLGAGAATLLALRWLRGRALPRWWQRGFAALGLASIGSVCLAFLPVKARPPATARSSQPQLVLVAIDSARRDHLGLYGYPRPTSPVIDALASEARVYDEAFAASTWTGTSVERMLRVATPSGTLQATLAASGYRTGVFSDNPYITARTVLGRGFEHAGQSPPDFREVLEQTMLGEAFNGLVPLHEERLVESAIAWLRADSRPTFLYVHLMGAHFPYRNAPIDGLRRPGRQIDWPRPNMNLTGAEIEGVIARYDAGLKRTDASLGRILEAVRELGQPYLAIVTADHGECLGEGGRWFHGRSLSPEQLRVPMLVVGTGVITGRVAGPVGHVSIAPTLLAAAGLPCTACPGSDLRTSDGSPVVEGGRPPHELYRVAEGHMLVLDRRTGKSRLYDIVADPQQTRDLAENNPGLVARLKDGLRPDVRHPRLGDENQERLRALGYIGA
jgi:arylsulfatase A-like enzyme